MHIGGAARNSVFGGSGSYGGSRFLLQSRLR